MSEQTKAKLFREKNLKSMESPESLNDYLKVTSPGVWLILAAVICLLVGAILWGIFGHIRTTSQIAVSVSDGKTICYVPFDHVDSIVDHGVISLDGQDYPLDQEAECELIMIESDVSVRVLRAGNLNVGDFVVLVPADTDLQDGVYTGVAVTEDLRPINLLLQ